MNKTRAWIIAAAAIVLGACSTTPTQPPAPKGADLTGNWVLTTESQMGAQDAQMTVRQTGSALAGTITGQAGSVDYQGTVNGAAVAFDFTISVQGTDLKLDYTGTVEGDTMKGKAVFGQFGEGTFTAKRQ
ncbi:hypothetical protein GCM10011487_00720 [Steroidobacter agaridevorans]|uniref:Lipocalin-like domain-containing protein n=1 Tax=Steroidobacter agaridevorans TaxID=2695856 RepID=A0A829Y620_9GAMM|nr:hypothetical protein [Steroidobacter agaridevorans]GFE78072.1 hypothetical protein GCM10011487_00720 [Steroidobacter agaridevorans]GFE91131.1 hypothetical protein GCM10011488_60850 [Steroidobacter agaridevorans]